MHRCILRDDCDLLDEADEVDNCAVWLLPASATARLPTLLPRSLISFANSRSEEILD
jgi:hypothetical protein